MLSKTVDLIEIEKRIVFIRRLREKTGMEKWSMDTKLQLGKINSDFLLHNTMTIRKYCIIYFEIARRADIEYFTKIKL